MDMTKINTLAQAIRTLKQCKFKMQDNNHVIFHTGNGGVSFPNTTENYDEHLKLMENFVSEINEAIAPVLTKYNDHLQLCLQQEINKDLDP